MPGAEIFLDRFATVSQSLLFPKGGIPVFHSIANNRPGSQWPEATRYWRGFQAYCSTLSTRTRNAANSGAQKHYSKHPLRRLKYCLIRHASVKAGAASGKDLRAIYVGARDKFRPKYGDWVIFDHCLPFDVTRAYDEVTKYPDPRIWTAQRDQEMRQSLEG